MQISLVLLPLFTMAMTLALSVKQTTCKSRQEVAHLDKANHIGINSKTFMLLEIAVSSKWTLTQCECSGFKLEISGVLTESKNLLASHSLSRNRNPQCKHQ